MILFDIEAALAHIAAQKPATVANPAKPANPLPAASPEPVLISGISGISEAGTLCAAHHGDLLAAPAGHCPACGSPSWWRSPSSPTWRCAYCEPRDRSRIEAHESLTLASGQWAPGTRPLAPEPVTVDALLALHGPVIAGCRTLDVLELADDGDLPDFLADRAALEGFAAALVADRRIRPLPDASLPPLDRLALEIGDDAMELRRWLDQSAQGRRIRQRIEREAGAIDRCLLGLRADPDTGLHAVLVRVLEGHQDDDRTRQLQADERIQDDFGAWRTPTERDRIAAYDRHHWHCDRCIRAGRGYGDRCADGERLHAAMRAAS